MIIINVNDLQIFISFLFIEFINLDDFTLICYNFYNQAQNFGRLFWWSGRLANFENGLANYCKQQGIL